MSLSLVAYTGNGATTNYSLTFPYISRDDVFASVAGVLTAFTFLTSSSIQFSPAPANGAAIVLFRNTPRTTPVATLVDGQVDSAAAYNQIALQMLYSTQEIEDAFISVEDAQAAVDTYVVGPVSVTDDLPAVFDGTTGKLLKSKTYAAFKALLLLSASDVALANVDNTTDLLKPLSTAAINALALKAPLASPTFTGTVTLPAATVTLANMANMATASLIYRRTAATGVPEVNTLTQLKTDLTLVKADVGLGSVDNTSDAGKPVSTAQQTALNLKAGLAGPTFTGVPAAPTAAAATNTTQLATTAFVTTADNLKANLASPTFTGTVGGITKAMVGLGNVDNTADASKPVSTAQAAADAAVLAASQPLDADLTAIAAQTATTDSFLQSKASSWVARTIAQVKTDLGLTGTNSGDQTITLTGDVTGSGTGSFATAIGALKVLTAMIADAQVTLAKMANMATASLIYRRTAGTGVPEVNTLAQLKTDLTLVKGDVGLGSVDNTSDVNKPVSTAQATADALKIAGPGVVTNDNPVVFSGTTGLVVAQKTYAAFKTLLSLVKGDVGLGNVDNTADTAKPVSTAQQTALDLKANLASPTFTGTPAAPTAAALVNTTQLATTAFVTGATREKLSGNLTLYCDWTNGNDANVGRSAGAGNAYKTIQKAWDVIMTLDLSGFVVTIQLADGTYTSGLVTTGAPVGGRVVINGNAGTPANVIVSTTSSNALYFDSCGSCTIQNMELRTTTAGDCITSKGGNSSVVIGVGMRFGACAGNHIYVVAGGYLNAVNAYSIVGAAVYHKLLTVAGKLEESGATITITGTPAFTTFVNVGLGSTLSSYSVTYSGAATGPRYVVSMNGQLQTYGGGASYFPGNSAGATATGGQYA